MAIALRIVVIGLIIIEKIVKADSSANPSSDENKCYKINGLPIPFSQDNPRVLYFLLTDLENVLSRHKNPLIIPLIVHDRCKRSFEIVNVENKIKKYTNSRIKMAKNASLKNQLNPKYTSNKENIYRSSKLQLLREKRPQIDRMKRKSKKVPKINLPRYHPYDILHSTSTDNWKNDPCKKWFDQSTTSSKNYATIKSRTIEVYSSL